METLRIHCLQHVHFEGPALIREWALQRGHEFSFTRFYDGAAFPDMNEIDWLVIMGGPMGVDDHDKFPWIAEEIRYIRKAIDRSKVVLGICLGAQLIARALGADVHQGRQKEIGWFPVSINKADSGKAGLDFLPDEITAFHWHQDTFDIPAGALNFASSKACPNQAFVYHNTVLALQFHIEMDLAAIEVLIRNSGEELSPGEYVQTAAEMLKRDNPVAMNKSHLWKILDNFEKT